MALAGKYELVREEGQAEHMAASGVPEEFIKKNSEQKLLEIVINGDEVQLVREKGPSFKLNLKQTTEEKTPDGKVMKNTSSLSGNVLTVQTEGPKGSFTRVYTLEGSELTVDSKRAGVPDGKRIFKKL